MVFIFHELKPLLDSQAEGDGDLGEEYLVGMKNCEVRWHRIKKELSNFVDMLFRTSDVESRGQAPSGSNFNP